MLIYSYGGGGRIRTPETLSSLTVFQTAGQAIRCNGMNWDKGWALRKEWKAFLTPQLLRV